MTDRTGPPTSDDSDGISTYMWFAGAAEIGLSGNGHANGHEKGTDIPGDED
jgi:hypothetical protein